MSAPMREGAGAARPGAAGTGQGAIPTSASRLLRGLDAALASARGDVDSACLQADKAMLLARRGGFDEARALLGELRTLQGRLGHPLLAARLCLVDALLEYYQHESATSRDRARRAHALAVAARDRALMALCAAWLGHLEYHWSGYLAATRRLGEALQESAPTDHAVRARACVTLALMHQFCGRPDLAAPWNRRGHQHAVALGDDHLIGNLMYNRALCDSAEARLAALYGGTEDGVEGDAQTARILMAAESGDHYYAGMGLSAFSPYLYAFRARGLSLQGEPERALALYDQHVAALAAQGDVQPQACDLAEVAWCLSRLGRNDEALVALERARARTIEEADNATAAIALGRQAEVLRAASRADEARSARAAGEAALAAHRAEQAELLRLIGDALKHVTL